MGNGDWRGQGDDGTREGMRGREDGKG